MCVQQLRMKVEMEMTINGDSSNNYRVAATSGMSMQMMLDNLMKDAADLAWLMLQRE